MCFFKTKNEDGTNNKINRQTYGGQRNETAKKKK